MKITENQKQGKESVEKKYNDQPLDEDLYFDSQKIYEDDMYNYLVDEVNYNIFSRN